MIRGVIVVLILGLLFLESNAQVVSTIKVDRDIVLYQLSDSVFIHTTWHTDSKFGRFPSNGMLVVSKGEAILIDTPNTNEQTEALYDFLNDSLGIKITQSILCHWHSDCMGGIDFLKRKEIETIANVRTARICEEKEMLIPERCFKKKLYFNFHGTKIECFFPGGAHTADNIVVYIPQSRILFAGCLIKSNRSRSLGYTGDAVIDQWDKTIHRVMHKFRDANIVVPGHGRMGDLTLCDHTLKLVISHKLQTP